jgi:26S proteasome non-ATPase regulatory subunit 5
MDEEWCREKLEKLKIDETRNEALQDILQEIKTTNQQSPIILNFIQAPDILDTLSVTHADEQTSQLACEVLSICLSNISLEMMQTTNAPSIILASLASDNPKIQNIGIKELSRVLDHDGAVSTIVDESLLTLLFKCLRSPESRGGIIEVLVKVLPKFLVDGNTNIVRENFEQTFCNDEVVRLRTYEIGVKLSQQSPLYHARLEFLLDRALSELESKDYLVEMNVLELLSALPTTQHGLMYLENKGIFDILLRKINTLKDDPFASLLGPGLIRFFGNVAAKQPEKIFNGYPNIITLLFDALGSNDLSVMPTALDTLGHLARSTIGKKHLDAIEGNKMQKTLKSIDLANYSTDLKIRAINCLSNVFFCADIDNQIASITQSWFQTISPSQDLTFVMNLCRNPFPELKMAGLDLLKSIVRHQWGQLAVLQTGGFLEYLLDRKVDNNKDATQEKYEVIKVLAESTMLDAQLLVHLKR